MGNFNIGEWEAYLEYRHEMLGWFLYLGKKTPDGRSYLTRDGTVKIIKPSEAVKNDDELYFAFFEDDQQLQAIADAISKRGIKDQNDHKNAGLLEATRAHLEDMRRLVFEPPIEISVPRNTTDSQVEIMKAIAEQELLPGHKEGK